MRKKPRWKRLALACLAGPAILCAAEATYRGILLFSARFLYGEGGAFELYALGGSVAQGYPYSPDVAFPAVVSKIFDGKIADRRISVHVVSAPGNSGYTDYLALRKTLPYRDAANPAVTLILAGGNEILSNPSRGLAAYRKLRALKEGMLGNSLLLSDLLLYMEKKLHWFGIRDLDTFEFYLRRTIEVCLKAKATPILVAPAFNASGVEPLEEVIQRGRNQDASSALDSGLDLEDGRQYRTAIRYYAYLARRYPGWRSLFEYRIARCHQALGEYEAARERYSKAWDIRLAVQRNAIVERLAKEYHVPWINAVELFERHSPHGVIGNELFADEVHPNVLGQILLADAFAREISALFKEPPKRSLHSARDVFQLASYPDDLQACAWVTSGLSLLRGWTVCPHIRQRLRTAELDFRNAARLNPGDDIAWFSLGLVDAAQRGKLTPEDFKAPWFESYWVERVHCFRMADIGQDRSKITRALKEAGIPQTVLDRTVERRPSAQDAQNPSRLAGLDGWQTASREAFGLDAQPSAQREAGNPDPADPAPGPDPSEYRGILPVLAAITERRPKNADPWLELAHAAIQAGRRESGLSALGRAKALALNSEQLHRLAILYQECRNYPGAIKILDKLLNDHPNSAVFLSDRGLCEYLEGSPDAAVHDLKASLRSDPRWLPAYLTLGSIYASAKRYGEALAVYEQALSLSPEDRMDPLRRLILSGREEILSKEAKPPGRSSVWR